MSLDITLWENEKCPHCGKEIEGQEFIHNQNITHNLTEMASKAGIYKYLWRGDENGVKTARQIINPLRDAISDMENRPEFYKQFNAENGWGTYDDFLPWLEDLLIACQKHPNAKISWSR